MYRLFRPYTELASIPVGILSLTLKMSCLFKKEKKKKAHTRKIVLVLEFAEQKSMCLNKTSVFFYILTARDVFKLFHSKYKKSDLTVHSSFFEIYSGKVSILW